MALSVAAQPPVHEVIKWYQSLDQIVNKCSTEHLQMIKGTFEREKIILTETDGVIGWARFKMCI